MQTKDLETLIDAASAKVGSDYGLAKRLCTTRQAVSDWRKGRKKCPPADVALMAQIAGFEPEAWLARAVCSQYEGEKREMLQSALKKSLAAIGVVIATSGSAEAASHFIRCINRSITAYRKRQGFHSIRV